MTVICFDGKTLAADRQCEMNGGKFAMKKIGALPDGTLIGTAGDTNRALVMYAWAANGFVPGDLPAVIGDEFARMLVVRPDGIPFVYANSDQGILFAGKHVAIGSGQDYAMTAMHLGLDAYAACQVACDLCSSCGMGIDAMEL